MRGPDSVLKGGICRSGELLPKPKGRPGTNENKMELIYKDGHSYFVPAPEEGKINGVRRWEQAFQVYVTLYSQANPARSAEIWQYVHTINMAAASYQWDNVANYDFTFRQLMGKFPQRSWAKIYNQMWCLSMKDPVQKGPFKAITSSGRTVSKVVAPWLGMQVMPPTHPGTPKKTKPNYCWAYNK